ncbi:MAG: LacI family DNA-binding transcriptional regulator [Lachnospiraceae bacterium]|nr:LacI family DNA-binding transcriptional regulator [Lachnospiraceae bacterium]
MAGTIQQIAQLAGVSRGTVDRALNHRGRIAPDTAAEIERIAKELDYVPKRGRGSGSSSAVRKMGKRKIGVITQLCGASFMIEVHKGLHAVSDELESRDIRVLMRESEGVDADEQLGQIDELLQEGIDALAIMPVSSDSIRQKLNQISGQGIPVITFNSDITGTDRLCFVGLDNRRSGATAAGLMGLMAGGEGKILVITGSFSNEAGSRRVDGFVETLKADFPGMELVGVQSSSDKTQEVERIVLQTMTVYPELKGIFVTSGGQAGLADAFRQLRPDRKPLVIAYDLTPKNACLLRDGTIDLLIDQECYVQGYRAVLLLADKLGRGREPEKTLMYTDISIRTKYNIY